jgi:hypothetical protein
MNLMIIDSFVKQHLELITGFVEMNRRMTDSFQQYRVHYTTLEETKEYIKTHRKPELTMEEAMRQVAQE